MYPWLEPYQQRFQKVWASNRIPHAFLLVGPSGMGKAALAAEWASLFLCEQPQQESACGVCHSCQLLRQHSHPDWHLYGADDTKSIGVDTIRQLSAQLVHSPQQGKGKVAVISQAERMTEAAENALKVARIVTGRTGVIAFDGGFHGRTLATVNLNGKVAPYKQGLGNLSSSVYHIPYPSQDNGITTQDAKKALARLFQVEVDIENISAIIFEPVLGEGCFQMMNPDFAQYLQQFCQEHGILMIVDEIQSGFGRTGTAFAFSHLGIQPDLLLLGESIAGGMPLGAASGT